MKRKKFLQTLLKGGAASAFFMNYPVSSVLAESFDHRGETYYKELKRHRIAAVNFSDALLKWPRHVGKNARRDVHGETQKIRTCTLITDQGARGWGMPRGSRRAEEEYAAYVKGKRITEIFDPGEGVTDEKALLFDIPLHDLTGHILNKPVYEILGKKDPIITRIYSGMIYMDDLEPLENPAGIDKVLQNCQYDYDYGYRQFKLKIGRGNIWMPKDKGLARDIAVTKMVAENFPDCEILVDANDGYTIDDTIAYVKGIGDIPLFWIEEPFPETVQDYQKLRAWLKENNIATFLADGEANPDPVLLKELIERRLIDVHLTDILSLGFTPWRKLMPELKKMNCLASPHAWGALTKSYYIGHLAGGLGNTVTIEGITATSDDIDFSKYKIVDGKLIVPSEPGFGMELLTKTK